MTTVSDRPERWIERLHAAMRGRAVGLCVGLDPEPGKLPAVLADHPQPLAAFCMAIVDATADIASAFKPQIAYFAAQRAEDQLEALLAHIRRVAPQVPVILDAKRGDIGETAQRYAREAFERYDADAVTLSPFMGFDSIEPFLGDAARGVYVLCRTSNPGGDDLQNLRLDGGERLYMHVAGLAAGRWSQGREGQIGLVVGATYPDELATIRERAAQAPLLIPGVGAQGGDEQAVVRALARGGAGAAPALVASSRAILYASGGPDFAQASRDAAERTLARLAAAQPAPAGAAR